MKRITLQLETAQHEEIIDVTARVQESLDQLFEGGSGCVMVYCPHTTAGVTVNESDDPDVKHDFLLSLNHMITCEEKFKHAEGNSKAHVSSVMTGVSCWIPVDAGKLVLGHWQSIWFCEFDGPRKRQLWIRGMISKL